MSPATAVPDGVRLRRSYPPHEKTTVALPGGGAGTVAWNTATATTAASTHSVDARAPHFVLPFQNSAAIRSGDSAAKPENAYWTASSKIDSGALSATR